MHLRYATFIGVALLAAGAFALAGCERREQAASGAEARGAGNSSASTEGTDRDAVETARLRGMSEIFDDAAITAKVEVAIASSIGENSTDVSVETRAAVVTLTGEVDTPDIRDRADRAALGIDGVKSVIDNMVVRSSVATG